jgi:DNA-binding Xre family transcriptional regulator
MTKSVLDAICRVLDVEVEGVLVYVEEGSEPTE